jgi:hypothetical protein
MKPMRSSAISSADSRNAPDLLAAAPRLLVSFGLSGWALLLSLSFAALLALKLVDWPAVGWFLDAGGQFQAFGFVRPEAGWREVLGGWSLLLFGALAAGFLWAGVVGTARGLRTARRYRLSA